MQAVLDTNVVVSGFLNPYGPSGEILRLVSAGEVKLYYDSRILAEYREVLRRPKFQIDPGHVESFLEVLGNEGFPVIGKPLTRRLPDATDEPFLEVALAAGVCLVTGNLKHFPKHSTGAVKVLSPSQFFDLLRFL